MGTKTHPILHGRLSVYERSWETKNRGTQTSFVCSIWQPKIKKKARITLKSRTLNDAKIEAVEIYNKHSQQIDEGVDVAVRRKRLPYFITEFMEFQQGRAVRGQITEHRARCIGSYLKSFERFWEAKGCLPLDDLQPFYERDFIQWRNSNTREKLRWKGDNVNRPLANRTINGEIVTHKMFVRWCVQRGYATKLLECEELLLEKANQPFPERNYKKLTTIAQRDIQNSRSKRHQWSAQNYYHIILLMNRIGCRVVEIKNLQWSHITQVKDGTQLYLWGKKGRDRIKERWIIIPPRVAEYLERLREYKRVAGEEWGWNEDDYPYIFSRWQKATRQVYFDTEIRRRWMKEAGIKDPTAFEYVSFRHKFITDALKQGVHSLPLAEYCGTSSKQIEQTYAGFIFKDVYNLVFKNVPDDAMSAKNVLPKFLSKED